MTKYHKTYSVHNTLVTFGIWEKHQTEGWRTMFGTGAAPAIFDVHAGVADVYYHGVLPMFRTVMNAENKKDPQIFTKMMDRYETQLESIQARIARGKPFTDVKELATFAQEFQDAWIGLDFSYMPDFVALDASAERRAAAVREKAFGFYIGADRLIRQTIEALFPKISPFADFVTLDELVSQTFPSKTVLAARAEHFIYFRGEILTGETLVDFCRRESIQIESIYAQQQVRGLIAEGGTASGPVDPGSILVARDLAPADMDSLKQAKAVVLDAGSYYSFAAIAARVLKKPCLFGTGNATTVLQSGDVLKVDGESGNVIRE